MIVDDEICASARRTSRTARWVSIPNATWPSKRAATSASREPSATSAIRCSAEHLDVSPEQVAAAMDRGRDRHAVSRPSGATDARCGKYERLDEVSDALVAVASVADPEHRCRSTSLISQMPPEDAASRARPRGSCRWPCLCWQPLLTAIWRYTPLAALGGRRSRDDCGRNRFSCVWWAPHRCACWHTRRHASCCSRARSSRCSPWRHSGPGTALRMP